VTCVWFTGLSGSGKTTTLDVLAKMLPEYRVLDGVTTPYAHCSSSQTLSIGCAAADLTQVGQSVICAAISTVKAERAAVRAMFSGLFLEVYMSTPLALCTVRDKRSIYRLDNPNPPLLEYEYGNPDMTLCTVCASPDENARKVYERLHEEMQRM